MRVSHFAFSLALGLGFLNTATVHSQTIYPLHRAEILAGSKFDFKVEFPGAPKEAVTSVTINGTDVTKILGSKPAFVEREDGQDYSALVLRDVTLTKPGNYTVSAKMGDQIKTVSWDVYAVQKPRVAKNVILFIGDGLSVAHRTAAPTSMTSSKCSMTSSPMS